MLARLTNQLVAQLQHVINVDAWTPPELKPASVQSDASQSAPNRPIQAAAGGDMNVLYAVGLVIAIGYSQYRPHRH